MQKNCPICKSLNTRETFNKGEYIYRKCLSCQVLFVANPPPTEEIHALYSEAYYEATTLGTDNRQGYPSYMQAQESLTKSFGTKLSLVQSRAPSGRLLDAGAAYGTFLRLASSVYECVGLEVSHYAASVAQSQFGTKVEVGSIEHSSPFPDEYFDAVVMWDIIEHLISPVAALKEAFRILKPGAYIFISTDDANNWLPKLLGQRWWALGAPLHLCHFSKQGMKIAFERAGNYELIEMVMDLRQYSIPEVIQHFGVSYQSNLLTKLGTSLDRPPLSEWVIDIRRPEQFITIARKKTNNF
jgi:SAM-dependent methyltransferase